MSSFTFPKSERICLSRELEAIFGSGNSLFVYPFKLVWHMSERDENAPPVMMMVSVGKKRFKHAVDRNKVKRRVREAYRLNNEVLHNAIAPLKGKKLLIGFLYIGKEIVPYHTIEEKMKVLMGKLINEATHNKEAK